MPSASTTLPATSQLAIAHPDDDPAMRRHVNRLLQSVPTVLDRLASGRVVDLSGPTVALVNRCAMILAAAEPSERARLVTHPLFHYWWTCLARLCASRRPDAIEAWLADLGRFFAIPGLASAEPGPAWRLRANGRGELRFPGHRRHLVLPDAAHAPVELSRQGEALTLVWPQGSTVIAAADLLDLDREPRSDIVVDRPVAAVTGAEIDGGDELVAHLFDQLMAQPAPVGYPPKNIEQLVATADQVAAIDAANQLVTSVWPELGDEMASYTRLIVPFASRHFVSSFVESVFLGAIFISEASTPFTDIWATAENIVHEHSHLRMCLILELDPVIDGDPNAIFESPFRRDRRPIRGILQGAFVFARVAQFYRRALDSSTLPSDTADALARHRADICHKLHRALQIIADNTRPTSFGAQLLAELAAEAAA